MNLDVMREALLWCTVINYGIVIVWFAAFRLAHDWTYRLHSRWYRLSVDQFDAIHYHALAVYKVGILLLNLVPLIALYIVG